MPNLLKYRDEWTKKKAKNSGETPDKLRRKESDIESDIEEDIKNPPISPASGGQEGAKENSPCIADENSKPAPGSRDDGTNPRALGTNPRAVQEQGDFAECSEQEPPIEFQELRQFFDAEMRPEGPMAGWKEYKQAKAGGYLPGVSRIVQDIEERKKAGVWNRGYEIGLGRYLAERNMACASQNPRLTQTACCKNGVSEKHAGQKAYGNCANAAQETGERKWETQRWKGKFCHYS